MSIEKKYPKLRKTMNNIKDIKLTKNSFIVDMQDSSLNLKCDEQEERYIIDISAMNLINATRTAIFCSTFCFLKNFKKKLCWLVKDEETKRAISILRLKNVEQIIKEQITPQKQQERPVLVS